MALGVAARQTREHEPLVGRADELDSLEQVLDELDRGPPGCDRAGGRAGDRQDAPALGSSRLVPSCAGTSFSRGRRRSSSASCRFRSSSHALDEYVESLDPNLLSTLDDDVQAELAHVFPSLSALGGGRAVALQHERYRSHRAVRALLEHLAQPRPLVLVLDDFHWADPASVELLGALLRRPPAAAVLIAVALRPRQTPERLAAALERADRAAALTRVEFGALTLDEAQELLGERVDAAGAAALYRGERWQPLLPRAARPVARARRREHPCSRDLTDRPRGASSGRRLAERRARVAIGRGTTRARRSGGGGRSVRARAGGRRGRHI